ncbi:MAG: hypothetical protein ACK5TK_12820 [Betaproteobacteria bacterium]
MASVAALALGAMALWPARAVPPPPAQVAANCEAPTYASDLLVCGDASLRALDRRMLAAYAAAGARALASDGEWIEPQEDWFKRRSRCAFSERHAACLHAAYAERIEVLHALAAAPGPAAGDAKEWSCSGPPGRSTLRLAAGGTATLRDADGKLLAVAFERGAVADWVPYVRIVVRARGDGARTVELRSLRGARFSLDCTSS